MNKSYIIRTVLLALCVPALRAEVGMGHHDGCATCPPPSQSKSFFLADFQQHAAPVLSVSWMCHCNGSVYAAIGGYSAESHNGLIDIRVFKLNHAGKLEEIQKARTSFGNYVLSLAWCCAPRCVFEEENVIGYLAVGGYPTNRCMPVDSIREDDGEQGEVSVKVYKLTTDGTLEEVASFAHGATVRAVAWLCDCRQKEGGRDGGPVCGEYGPKKFLLGIGGDAGFGRKEIRMLEFVLGEDSSDEAKLFCVDSAIHGASIYTLDFCQGKGHTPLLVAAGKLSTIDKKNVRVYGACCKTGAIVELTNADILTDSTIYTAKWCCLPGARPSRLYVAFGGGVAIQGTPSNVAVCLLNPRSLELKPIVSALQPTKVFALDWNPMCACSQLTVGSACDENATTNITEYALVTAPQVMLSTIASTKFDDNITSLAWCKDKNCAYLLVGSEKDRPNENAEESCGSENPEIALYRASFCTEGGHEPTITPICARDLGASITRGVCEPSAASKATKECKK